MIKATVTQKGIYRTTKEGLEEIPVGAELTHNGDTIPASWVNKVQVEAGTGEPTTADDDELEVLRAEYEEAVGKSADKRMKADSLRKAIDEALAQ